MKLKGKGSSRRRHRPYQDQQSSGRGVPWTTLLVGMVGGALLLSQLHLHLHQEEEERGVGTTGGTSFELRKKLEERISELNALNRQQEESLIEVEKAIKEKEAVIAESLELQEERGQGERGEQQRSVDDLIEKKDKAPEGHELSSSRVSAPLHRILELGEAEFRGQAVSELMSSYSTAVCDHSFGNGLIDKWRAQGKQYCKPKQQQAGGGEASPSSSIECYLARQDDHAGNGDNLCHMKNVAINFGAFSDTGVIKGVMEKYKNTKHADEAYIHHKKGTVKGTCDADPGLWQTKFMPGWNADWTTNAFQPVDALLCDEWVEHKTLIVQRHTFANFFHDSEDFVNAFIAMAVLRWSSRDTQVMITDLYPKGPFWPMWSRVFHGQKHAPMLAWDIAKQYGKKNVCFRDVAVGIFGPAAPTTLARFVTKCFSTALVRAYADFTIRGLDLQSHSRYAAAPSKKVVITWMSRKSSVQWPERSFCSEKAGVDSFFTCDFFQHLGTRSLQRVVKNDAEVVKALTKLAGETFSNGAEVEFHPVDYNLLSFSDQIQHSINTDVMVGPHGAGLFHNIFMADRGVLIELHIDGTSGRKHFNNLARWAGRKYVSRAPANPVSLNEVTGLVRQAIEEMDLTKH